MAPPAARPFVSRRLARLERSDVSECRMTFLSSRRSMSTTSHHQAGSFGRPPIVPDLSEIFGVVLLDSKGV